MKFTAMTHQVDDRYRHRSLVLYRDLVGGHHRAARLTCAAVLCVGLSGALLSACSPSATDRQDAERAVPMPPAPSAAVASFYGQQVHFTDCAKLECAEVKVPLNWAAPQAESTAIKVFRVRARHQPAKGSIVVNLGGPGDPYDDNFRDVDDLLTHGTLNDDFDMVGFDDRGVAGQAALTCAPPRDDAAPRTVEEAIAAGKRRAQECTATGSPVMRYMDSQSVARDLDVIRDALQAKRLNYIGYSYGTQYGYEYVRLFPGNAGNIVLDSPVDPNAKYADLFVNTDTELKRVIGEFGPWCQRNTDCAKLPGAATGTVFEAVERAYAKLPSGENSPWPLWTDMEEWLSDAMENERSWEDVVKAIAAITARNAEALADAMIDNVDDVADDDEPVVLPSDEPSTSPTEPVSEAHAGRMCADYPATEADVRAYAQSLRPAPLIDELSQVQEFATCIGWPAAPARDTRPLQPQRPVLILASTRDIPTPCVMAKRLHDNLPKSVLLVDKGVQHAIYPEAFHPYINTATTDFFKTGKAPAPHGSCDD